MNFEKIVLFESLKREFSRSEKSGFFHFYIMFNVELDDSAFFRTQSYITEICYFEYLLSLLYRWQKPFFFPIQSNIKPN